MKKLALLPFLFLFLTMSGCQVVGSIFGAGVYTGVFIVVIVVVIVVVLISKMSNKK